MERQAETTLDLDGLDFALDELPGRSLHDALAGFRERAPVTETRFLGLPCWIITSHYALADAFLDADRFPPELMYRAGLEPAIGRTFISMESEEHRVFRKLVTPAFRSRAVARYEREELAALAHELVDEFEGSSEVDLVSAFAARFPYRVISRLLGLPRDREDEFHGWALGVLRFRDDPEAAHRAAAALTEFVAPVVAARRRQPRNDVISELVQAEVEGRRLSDEEVFAHIRLLLPTGGETTHGALGNLLHALLTHDGTWEAIRAEPARAPDAVEEILRWETPIAVLPRMSRDTPVEFHGAKIPASSWVLFAIAGANRDPAIYEDPDRFDIDRCPKGLLTFGPGPKSCPGMHLARKNMTVALQVLTQRMERPVLLDETASRPTRSVLRAPEALRVALR